MKLFCRRFRRSVVDGTVIEGPGGRAFGSLNSQGTFFYHPGQYAALTLSPGVGGSGLVRRNRHRSGFWSESFGAYPDRIGLRDDAANRDLSLLDLLPAARAGPVKPGYVTTIPWGNLACSSSGLGFDLWNDLVVSACYPIAAVSGKHCSKTG